MCAIMREEVFHDEEEIQTLQSEVQPHLKQTVPGCPVLLCQARPDAPTICSTVSGARCEIDALVDAHRHSAIDSQGGTNAQ